LLNGRKTMKDANRITQVITHIQFPKYREGGNTSSRLI